ncbi:glucosaminidase domain-containing protein [Paenibacillus rhizovicinus]|uniref:Glucosaminidase domain-containing protein n=1 Tax=Paenibacillus rhizovicinus TaxID=2704463 RepID=A0A6C0P7X2_9BACL|nr:glucosaminidase domain-containing protein [Paenibacillus rhizovicinus]QHW34654.1 glucosaminidase domain-containing protein [Paenibacillus rhizovicinus]
MTDNGWLALIGGGYVHGRYAVPLSEQTDAQAAQTDASVPDPAKKREVAILSSSSASVQHRLLTNDAEASAAAEAVAETAAEADDSSNPVKPTSKIMSDSGMTRAHIAALLKGTKLQGLGLEDVILGVEEKYGINAFFIIAVMKLESGNGKSTLSRTKNNLFGLNAITGDAHRKAFTFKTKGDSIRKFGQLINDNYIGRGYTTIEKVARKYCPANGLWAGHVRTIMRGDFKKLV